MASIAFPSLAKQVTLSDGTTYGYVAQASAPDKPTILLLHGYPSSSYDWRHQIASLPKAGFGVIAPDLLGYGDTDSPEDVAAYRMKAMSQHMAEILDRESVSRCVAVSHDWLVPQPSTRHVAKLTIEEGVRVVVPPSDVHSGSSVRNCVCISGLRRARACMGHWFEPAILSIILMALLTVLAYRFNERTY